MRARRFARFRALIERLPRPVRILDVGGTNEFWEQARCAGNPGFEITLLNLKAPVGRHANIQPLAGDATDLGWFEDGCFDVAFSNSVIEHLFTLANQFRMAAEVRRVAAGYWIQTPNYWFPIEPHFRFIGWQWLPMSVRVGILRRRRCGWRGPVPDADAARRSVSEVRLMSRRELANAFPDARVEGERFMGLVKSWIVIGGLPAPRAELSTGGRPEGPDAA